LWQGSRVSGIGWYVGHAVAIAGVPISKDGAGILSPDRIYFVAVEMAQIVQLAIDLLGMFVALVLVYTIEEVARNVSIEEMGLRGRGFRAVFVGRRV
jgi:hypothetical protein